MQNSIAKPGKLDMFDLLRGFAIFNILLYHTFLFYLDKSTLTYATGIWENLSRFKNIAGYILASGYQGVHLFLIISGFLLTLSYLKKNYNWFGFYKKRLKRILVPYYPVFLICILAILISTKIPFIKNYSYLPENKIIIKALLFPFNFDFSSKYLSQINRAWWFLPLILEFYLIFPLLIYLLKKIPLKKFLFIFFVLTFIYRIIASFILKGSPIGVIYQSLGGSIPFIYLPARLFEFCFGMALGFLYFKYQDALNQLTNWFFFLMGIGLQILGSIFTYYRLFWPMSDMVIAIGIFLFSLNLLSLIGRIPIIKKGLVSLGNISYPLYLIHYLILIKFLTPLLNLENGKTIYLLFLPLYFLALFLLAKVVQFVDKKLS